MLETVRFSEESLGKLLQTAREQKGLELDQVERETRISLKNLRAMEADDYPSLPAEVFSRGFYALYAEYLDLDPVEIIQKYNQEKILPASHEKQLSEGSSSKEIGTMAARPSSLPTSTLGLLILVFILFGAFLCWYFAWNPAAYLSDKLRNVQNNSQNSDKPLKSPEKEFYSLQSMLSITSVSNASEVDPEAYQLTEKDGNYIITAQFRETTKVTLAIDNAPVYDCVYQKGEETTWVADENINITLPGKTSTLLSFNDTPIHLPRTTNTTLTISLPGDVLD